MEHWTFRPHLQNFPLKNFLIFSWKTCSEKFLIFSRKKPLIFWKRKSRKNPYVSGNRFVLYFSKRNLLILQETELSYVLGKVYSEPETYLELEAFSEPWHVSNPRHIQNSIKHLYGTFCKNNYLEHLKKVLIFLYMSGNGNPKKFLIFSQKEAVLIFHETETSKKILYISGNGAIFKLYLYDN